MHKEVKDFKPCFIGLEPFLKPKEYIKERKKLFKEENQKNVMYAFYCSEHGVYFWRDVIEQKGKCSDCKFFNSEIHFSVLSQKYKEECEDMKVKQSVSLEDGKYTGEIVDVKERKEPYEYTDFVIRVEDVELSFGCPSGISINKEGNPTTRLAKLLTQFGMKFKVNQDITIAHIKELVMHKKVAVLVENEETEKGTFARIVSIKPS